jgi:hypothetical protein
VSRHWPACLDKWEPHRFALVREKRVEHGDYILPVFYYRCEVCGYREVGYYQVPMGESAEPTYARERL